MDMMSLRRRVLVNQNKLMTATGNPITFNTPLTKPLKECVVRFTPQQSGSGTPSPENVREIVGKNGITVWQSGKNLFDYADGENIRIATSATDRKKTASSYGTITNDGNTVTLTRTLEAAGLVFILGKLQAGFTYTLSGTWDNIDNKAYIALLDTDVTDEYTSTRKYTISFHYNSVSFTPEETGIYEVLLWRGGRYAISASNVQLEHGSTATAYEPFTASVETSVSFPSTVGDSGVVYGGYLDAENGEVVEEKNGLVFDGSEAWYLYSSNEYACVFALKPGRKPLDQNEVCSHFKINGQAFAPSANHVNSAIWRSNSGTVFMQVSPSFASDVTAFKQFLADEAQKGTPVTIVANALNPIHYSLTPQSIATLKGQNVMWSDANGDITVKYWTR